MGGLSRRELQIIAGILAATVVAGIAHYVILAVFTLYE
jgi:hypothetical protein